MGDLLAKGVGAGIGVLLGSAALWAVPVGETEERRRRSGRARLGGRWTAFLQ